MEFACFFFRNIEALGFEQLDPDFQARKFV